ncbi:MAG: D-tyrosyl-tRNA(Tyr) deacylase [Bdellovibrionaceae bacterium]|nr:D-tyrosyl-tRNA(Tyr) deacylase [Pseudobdellovibrionaceae bacterium]|tara:strand:- start:2641 stop:3078 length:438 start_codon:yes stop_codon:yes gene_type:complete
MKAVIQRVKKAHVTVDDKKVGSIEQGILTLIGFEKGDNQALLEKMIDKIIKLRIFEDENGKMNKSLLDIQGQHLIVSQFTLAGNCLQGRRPSFTQAESPEAAKSLYEKSIELSKNLGIHTEQGVFQAEMCVSLLNDGPVTFILEL